MPSGLTALEEAALVQEKFERAEARRRVIAAGHMREFDFSEHLKGVRWGVGGPL